MTGVEIIGLGHYAPARRVANSEIETRLGLDAGWIEKRTGIVARRWVANGEALSDLAIAAADMALAEAGIQRGDVALVLLATSTPDHLLPPTSPLVAHKLGLTGAGAIDMAGACGGFIYALAFADSFVRAHQATVLVVAANVLSRRINPDDRASSVLFADAAGAVLLAPTKRADAGIRGVHLAADGAGYSLIHIPAGGSRRPFASVSDASDTLMIIEDGQAVFAGAVAMMTNAAKTALLKANIGADRVAHFFPHQANARMMAQVARQTGVAEAKMGSTIAEFGNSSAATIPFTMSVERSRRVYAEGEAMLLTAAGAGLTGGAIVFGW